MWARARIYEEIAVALDRLADDVRYLDELVEAARAEAWDEIASAVTVRLDRLVDPAEKNYELNRDLRIRYLKEVDLRMLARRQRRAARARKS